MPFRPVLELSVTHPGVPGGALAGAAIVPDAVTARRLAGLRYLARASGDRLVLLAETKGAATPLVALDRTLPLGFAIADLPPGTDHAALFQAPVFTDRDAGRTVPQQLRPIKGEGAPRIRMRLTATQVAAAMQGRVRRCAAPLPTLSALWCYHVVTDLAAAAADWRIVRGAGATGASLVFGEAGRAVVTAAATDDPTGLALVAAYPRFTVIRFVSDAPVAVAAEPVRGLELRVGETRLLASLPNPPPDALARLGDGVALQRTVRVITA